MSHEKLRVMTVFGTRPDTIKMAPVVHALRASDAIDDIVCVTAQHRQMLDDLLELFAIEPQYDLDIMTENQTLTQITTRVLEGMEPVLEQARPTSCWCTATRPRVRRRRSRRSINRFRSAT